MGTIKAFLFACIALILLTGGRCSISSTFDDDDDDEGLVIVVDNAETTSNEVIRSITQTLTLAEIASQTAVLTHDILGPSRILHACGNTNGVISVSTNTDNPTIVSIGSDLLLNYSNCNVDNVNVNGNLTVTLLEKKGIDAGSYASGTNWLYSASAKTDSLEVNRGNEIFIAKGGIIIRVEFDATVAELETNITSNSLSFDNETTNTLSAIDISQFINLAVMPSSYTLAIDSFKFTNTAQNGTVDATTTSDGIFGMELLSLNENFIDLHSPTDGIVKLSGKNSTASLSIMPDQSVAIDIDTNDDSVADAAVTSSWLQLNKQ